MKFLTSLIDRLLRKQRQAQCDIPEMDSKLAELRQRAHKVRNRNEALMYEAYGRPRPKPKT